ncbi:DoxX family protein [Arthrobacter sp. C152]
MPYPRSGPAVQSLSAAAMGALLLASANKHFRDPMFYRDVVPGYLCREDSAAASVPRASRPRASVPQPGGGRHPLAVLSREEWIAVTGLLELAAAVGILLPPTRKMAATALAGMFTVFLAGHLDALRRAYGPDGTPRQRKIHTARLPLQAPLVLWAWSLRKPGLPGRRRMVRP